METTLEMLVEALAEKFNQSDNYTFKRILEIDIIAARATLIKREYDKTRIFNEALLNTLNCVPLIKVHNSSCDTCNDANDFGYVLRTKDKLPKPLITKDGVNLLQSISTTLKGRKRVFIGFVRVEELEYLQYRKFTKNSIVATWEDGYIFIHNNLTLKNITVRGMFDNPLIVKDFNTNAIDCEECKGISSSSLNALDTCFNETGSFVIENSFINGIEALIFASQVPNYQNKQEIKVNE